MDYYASGKLMLFGEYLILKGSPCLAIPLKYGQKMQVENSKENRINWTSHVNGTVWFSGRFTQDLDVIETTDLAKAAIITDLLKIIKTQKPFLFDTGLHFKMDADFLLEWGFGSSSSLISCLAQWGGIDPYFLLEKSFGGSGYDVACAVAKTPVVYEMESRQTIPVYLFPKITSKVLFIYSGNKQNSHKEISRFNSLEIAPDLVKKMKDIILTATRSTQIDVFENCILESEQLLSEILGLPTIKESKFANYPFFIKSLGAWGGDFFMATYRKEKEARDYFSNLGYSIQFNYAELIKP